MKRNWQFLHVLATILGPARPRRASRDARCKLMATLSVRLLLSRSFSLSLYLSVSLSCQLSAHTHTVPVPGAPVSSCCPFAAALTCALSATHYLSPRTARTGPPVCSSRAAHDITVIRHTSDVVSFASLLTPPSSLLRRNYLCRPSATGNVRRRREQCKQWAKIGLTSSRLAAIRDIRTRLEQGRVADVNEEGTVAV